MSAKCEVECFMYACEVFESTHESRECSKKKIESEGKKDRERKRGGRDSRKVNQEKY